MKRHRLFVPQSSIPALVAGTKTQHRVLMKPQPRPAGSVYGIPAMSDELLWARKDGFSFTVSNNPNGPDDYIEECPYQPGDEVWVPEAWMPRTVHECRDGDCDCDDLIVDYPADDGCVYFPSTATGGWTPKKLSHDHALSPTTMPRWAARLFRTVKAVRVERVQDISEADAVAEGVVASWLDASGGYINFGPPSFRSGYSFEWNNTHGPSAWDRNDWVWVLDFVRIADPLTPPGEGER